MEVADLFMLDEGEINVEKEEILNLLRRIGLTDYESRAYLGLVMRSHGTAEEVADVASIPRTSAYKVLESLRRRNMVSRRAAGPPCTIRCLPGGQEKLLADAERRCISWRGSKASCRTEGFPSWSTPSWARNACYPR